MIVTPENAVNMVPDWNFGLAKNKIGAHIIKIRPNVFNLGIQLCEIHNPIKLPWDPSVFQGEDVTVGNPSIQIPYTQTIYNLITSVENRLKSTCVEEAKNIWPNPKDPQTSQHCANTIEESLTSTLRPTSNILKGKIYTSGYNPTKIFVVTNFSKEMNRIHVKVGSIQDVRRHSFIVPIVRVDKGWIKGVDYGISIVCTHILVYPQSTKQAFVGFVGADNVIMRIEEATVVDAVENPTAMEVDPSEIGSPISEPPSLPLQPNEKDSSDEDEK